MVVRGRKDSGAIKSILGSRDGSQIGEVGKSMIGGECQEDRGCWNVKY